MVAVKVAKYLLQLITFSVIFILAIDVVFLTIQNRKLKSAIQSYTKAAIEPLKSGEKVEPFKVISLNGDTIDFAYTDSEKRYLLFVLSTTCPHCENNLIHWQDLIDGIDNNKVNIFGISISDHDKTLRYVSEKRVGFYTCSIADTNFTKEYKIPGVPETILVSGGGVVEKVWIGELNDEHINEIKNITSTPIVLTNKSTIQ